MRASAATLSSLILLLAGGCEGPESGSAESGVRRGAGGAPPRAASRAKAEAKGGTDEAKAKANADESGGTELPWIEDDWTKASLAGSTRNIRHDRQIIW